MQVKWRGLLPGFPHSGRARYTRTMRTTVFRSCTLCEATCGLKFEVEDGRILEVRGDDDDVFSRGLICPQGVAIAQIHDDPDRLRTPVRRLPDGTFTPIGWEDVASRLAAFTPERVAPWSNGPADTIRRLARELVAAPSGVVHTRIGVCNARCGTLATWANDIVNLAAGRLGEVGGWMFPSPAIDIGGMLSCLGDGWGRWRSCVRQLPETVGDLPAATPADEIETPGPGQVRAMRTFAGNPVRSVPNGRRLERGLAGLDFLVSVDLYINETTRHADVILPPAGALAEEHVDLLFPNHAVQNTVRASPAVVERGPDEKHDWEILLEIAERMGGGPFGIAGLDGAYRWAKRVGYRWNPTTTADLLLRSGPRGDRFLP